MGLIRSSMVLEGRAGWQGGGQRDVVALARAQLKGGVGGGQGMQSWVVALAQARLLLECIWLPQPISLIHLLPIP